MSGLILSGATSGSTTIQATDAVTATITLPSATDTLVGKITPSFTTTIGVGNATPSASGAGITFPATQSASTDANTLDDYEEGSWTPAFTNTTITGGTPVYSGTYTKIGRMVYITAKVSGQTVFTSTANSSYINNLPFTVSAVNTVGNASSDGIGNFGVGVFFAATQFYIPTISVTTNSTYFTGWYQV